MKVSVFYRSMSGHSKKLAQAIAQELETEAVDIKKKPALENTDLIFLAGGIYSGKSLPEMLEFAKSITADITKKVVLITSSAADKSGQDKVREILTDNGVEVLDEYRCYGSFLVVKLGHPNKKEVQDAREFAKRFVQN